jgi:glycerol-3-phosphate acyltransferase PlsY
MGETWIIVIIIIASYLFGSISMTRLVTGIVSPGTDLEDVSFSIPTGESYHVRTISATTASLKLGSKVGGTIALLDMLKGLVPVLILRYVFPDQYYHLIAAVFIVVGHDWSIFYRFTGGGGLSTAYGSFFAIDLLGTIVSVFTGMMLGFAVFRDMMVAFASGPFLMLLWLIIFKREWPYIIFGIAMNVVIILKLLPDIIELSKSGGNKDQISMVMDQTGMGRGMKKMMKWMGLDPDKKKKNGEA